MSLNYGRLSISDQVLSQTVAGESVLLDLKSEKYFGLNDVGTRFWELLKQSPDARAARDALLAEFDVEPGELDKDLNELVDRLLAAGLVQKA